MGVRVTVGARVGVGVAVSGRGVVGSALGITVGASVGVLVADVGLGIGAHDAMRTAASRSAKIGNGLM